jgi:hypothetical protein
MGQNYVTDQTIAPEGYSSEAHAHWTAGSGEFCEVTKERNRIWGFAGKMLVQHVAGTEMGLVSICEEPRAFRAFPEWRQRHDFAEILAPNRKEKRRKSAWQGNG